MNGNKILLDTNAFIYFFEGRSNITNLVVNTPEIYFSAISEIELLSATHLTQGEIDSIKAFLLLCHRVELTSEIIDQTITIRRQHHFKIPDAIIAASALYWKIPLVSADTDFQVLEDTAGFSRYGFPKSDWTDLDFGYFNVSQVIKAALHPAQNAAQQGH